MTRAALLLALLLTASAPEAPVTTTVMGLTTEIGDQPLSNLGPWTWPSDRWRLRTDPDEDQATVRANGGFLVIEPTPEPGVFEGLGPSVAFESVHLYKLLGSDPFYFRFKLHDYVDAEPDAAIQMRLVGVDNRVTTVLRATGEGFPTDEPTISFSFRYTEPSGTFPFFVEVFNDSFQMPYDPALHRWVQLSHDPVAGKLRWEVGGKKWVTAYEIDEPSDTSWLTGFEIDFSIIQAFSGGVVSATPAWIGPLNETPDEGELQLLTELLPLPEIGPSTELRLVTEVGDDPPDPPDDLDDDEE